MGRSTGSAEHQIEWKAFSHFKSFSKFLLYFPKNERDNLISSKRINNVVLCWEKIFFQGVNNQNNLRDQASQMKDSRHIPVSAKLRLRQQMLPLNRAY